MLLNNELNVAWTFELLCDAIYDGRLFRSYTVIDEGNREALHTEVVTSIPPALVVRVLVLMFEVHERPYPIRLEKMPNSIGIA